MDQLMRVPEFVKLKSQLFAIVKGNAVLCEEVLNNPVVKQGLEIAGEKWRLKDYGPATETITSMFGEYDRFSDVMKVAGHVEKLGELLDISVAWRQGYESRFYLGTDAAFVMQKVRSVYSYLKANRHVIGTAGATVTSSAGTEFPNSDTFDLESLLWLSKMQLRLLICLTQLAPQTFATKEFQDSLMMVPARFQEVINCFQFLPEQDILN